MHRKDCASLGNVASVAGSEPMLISVVAVSNTRPCEDIEKGFPDDLCNLSSFVLDVTCGTVFPRNFRVRMPREMRPLANTTPKAQSMNFGARLFAAN